MRAIRRAILATLGLSVSAAAASAATIESGVVGLKLILLDKYALGKAKAVYVAKGGAGIQKGPGGDPPGLTGTVEIFPLSDPSNRASYALPADWLVNKDTVAKYVNKSAAPGGPGAKVVAIKAGLVGKLVAKNLGDGDAASGDQGASDFDLQAIADTDTIRVVVTVDNGNDGNVYVFCSDFWSLSIKKDGADANFKIFSKASLAPGSCGVAPPTTSTSTTTEPPTTSTTTTATTSSTTTTTLITGSALSLVETAANGAPTGIAAAEIFLAAPFSTGYVNVVIDLDGNGLEPGTDPGQGGDWWVQNRPLVIDAGNGGVSFTFALGMLSPSGRYDVYASFTGSPVTTPNPDDMVLTSQVPFGVYDFGGLTGPPDGLYHGAASVSAARGVGATDGMAPFGALHRTLNALSAWVERPAQAQLFDIEGQLRFDIPGIQQGLNECGPAAAAQSLLWLGNTYGIFPPLPPADDLVSRLKTGMRPDWQVDTPYPGVLADQFAFGKDTVVQELSLPITTTVWDYNAVTHPFDFIRTEMQADADVEIFLTSLTTDARHVATVAGWVQVGTDQYVCVKDSFFGGQTLDCYHVSLDSLENYKIAGDMDIDAVISERFVPTTTTTTTTPPTSTTIESGCAGANSCNLPCGTEPGCYCFCNSYYNGGAPVCARHETYQPFCSNDSSCMLGDFCPIYGFDCYHRCS